MVVGVAAAPSVAGWLTTQFGIVGDLAYLAPSVAGLFFGRRIHPAVQWAALGMLVSYAGTKVAGLIPGVAPGGTSPGGGSPTPQGGEAEQTIFDIAQSIAQQKVEL